MAPLALDYEFCIKRMVFGNRGQFISLDVLTTKVLTQLSLIENSSSSHIQMTIYRAVSPLNYKRIQPSDVQLLNHNELPPHHMSGFRSALCCERLDLDVQAIFRVTTRTQRKIK
jgi:hypothetical protein